MSRSALRLQKELQQVQNELPPGVLSCRFSNEDTCQELEAVILGPEGSPYADGLFRLQIIASMQYPISPPTVRFLTRVHHPNIDWQDGSGRICLDLLKMPPNGSWRPSIHLSTLLISIRQLLAQPNPDDPLIPEIAAEYRQNRLIFIQKAQDWTKRFATAAHIQEAEKERTRKEETAVMSKQGKENHQERADTLMTKHVPKHSPTKELVDANRVQQQENYPSADSVASSSKVPAKRGRLNLSTKRSKPV